MIYRFTGNPENWITAISHKAWALNENNKGLWEKGLKDGDIVIFHSTAKSDFSGIKPKSSVIGFGYIGEGKYVKFSHDLWWFQEKRDNKNYWPYVVPLKEIYLFSNTTNIDFEKNISEKKEGEVCNNISQLLEKAIPISKLNEEAHRLNSVAPNFPVNGSASGINEIYERLVLESSDDFYTSTSSQSTEEIEERLSETLDEKISLLTDGEIIRQAAMFLHDGDGYKESYGKKRVRKENQKQKRLVAKLYNYTCQVCNFYSEYKRVGDKKGYIIEIDHIVEKSEGGSETLNNLWVLCPNCHKEKTRGIIKICFEKKNVQKNGEDIKIKDKHLFIDQLWK